MEQFYRKAFMSEYDVIGTKYDIFNEMISVFVLNHRLCDVIIKPHIDITCFFGNFEV